MAHGMHRADSNPRHKRRKGRRHGRRHNPFANPRGGSDRAQQVGRFALATAMVAGVDVLTMLLLERGLQNVAWSNTTKAATKIGVGLVGGAALAAALPEKWAPVPMGVAIGGVSDGLRDLYDQYVAPEVARLMTPTPVATPAATTPGGQAYLPGGIPAGYPTYNPQSCAVPGY